MKSLMPLKDMGKRSHAIVSTWKQAEREVVARKGYRTSCYYHLTIAEVEAIMEYKLRV